VSSIAARDEAARLNKAWGIGAVQARYSYDGQWYATLARFPAALFDPHGYLYFATEEDYRAAPISIGKQISVLKPGISALPGYVRFAGSTARAPSPMDDAAPGEISVAEGREILRLHRLGSVERG
jgi:hypothetical protein